MRWSRASACSNLAEPITPINAEKKDVANSPSKIITPDTLACAALEKRSLDSEKDSYKLNDVRILVERSPGNSSSH